jgi:hypothetical protein
MHLLVGILEKSLVREELAEFLMRQPNQARIPFLLEGVTCRICILACLVKRRDAPEIGDQEVEYAINAWSAGDWAGSNLMEPTGINTATRQ